jgi:HEPN domain-containing protein
MNETVEEWIAKAEADFVTAGRERRARKSPNYDALCFHAQQGVEKLMKGLLILRGVVPPKTHDLIHLDQLLCTACPDWSWPVEELRFVSRAAVVFRYPGESATRKDAVEALELARRMRRKLLLLLKEDSWRKRA